METERFLALSPIFEWIYTIFEGLLEMLGHDLCRRPIIPLSHGGCMSTFELDNKVRWIQPEGVPAERKAGPNSRNGS